MDGRRGLPQPNRCVVAGRDPQPPTATTTPHTREGAVMSGWRWRVNLPNRYDPPAPHRPVGGEVDPNNPTADPTATPTVPPARHRNRSTRFPGAQR